MSLHGYIGLRCSRTAFRSLFGVSAASLLMGYEIAEGSSKVPLPSFFIVRYVPSFFPPPLLAAFLRPAVINISRERRLVRLGSIAPLMFRHAWPPCQPTLPTHPTSALAGREGDSKSHYGGIKAERGGGWVRGGIGKQKLCFDTVKLTPLRPFLPFSKNLVLDEDNTPENG